MHKNILVADDDPAVLRLIGDVLQRPGYRVVPASNFASAITLWSVDTFDLAIIDYKLADESGADLAEYIFAHDRVTPIIIISGFLPEFIPLSREIRQHVHFLGKPFAAAELRELVSALLAHP